MFAHCTREEFAGDTEFHDTSKTYSHLMSGQCRCGTRHGDAAKLGDSDGHRNLVATYDYYLLNGELAHQTLRYEPKDFSQRRPDGQGGWVYKNVFKDFEPVLYRLPEVYEAIRKGEPVLLCEGEKDADRGAEELGICTTTCAMGAKKWRPSYTQVLRGADVIAAPHNDKDGRAHTAAVVKQLPGVAKSVKLVELPGVPENGGDLSDWIDAGGTREDLDRLVEETDSFRSCSPLPSESDLNECLPAFTVGQIKERSGKEAELHWICPLFMRAGEITLLAGESKRSGKTTLMMHMLKAVHDGAPFMGAPTQKTGALVLTEQGNNILEATAKAGIRDDDQILITPYKDVSKEEWDTLIERARLTCKVHDLGILVVDTLSAFSKLRGSEENLSGEIIERMEAVLEAARVDGLHVCVLHHTGKDGEIRGSTAFQKDPDVIWVLKRPVGDHQPNVRTLAGLGRYDAVNTTFNIALEGDGYVRLGSDKKIEYEKAKALLLKEVPEGEENAKRRTMVLEALEEEVSRSTLQRALEDLTDVGAVLERTQKGKGNPKVLWRPRRKTDDNDSFKSDSEGRGEHDLNEYSQGEPGRYIEELNAKLISDKAALSAMVEDLKSTPEIAFDVETYPQDETARSLDPRRGKVGVISLSSRETTYVIDRKVFTREDVLAALEGALPGSALVAHNAPFDLAFIRRDVGYEHKGRVFDTLVLDAMLFYASGPLAEKDLWRGFLTRDKELGYKKSLSNVAKKFLGASLNKEEQTSDWGGDLTREMISYAAIDAAILLPLKDKIIAELGNIGMEKVVDVEARFTPAMSYCSDNGFVLDVEGWHEHAREAKKALQEAKALCDRIAPEPPDAQDEDWEWSWNASNHRKVGRALELLGAKVDKSQSTGNYKTDEAALKAIKHPKKAKALAEAILDYRAHEKYVTTWGQSWFREPEVVSRGKTKGKIKQGSPGHLQVVDGRVYTKLNQLVATGRGSSRSPNLQNLPPSLREFFIAPPGRRLLVADYSQMEYVAAAYISGDEALLEPLRRGTDYHTLTAQMIGVERSTAKMVNFALLYGMSAKTLASRLGVPKERAQEYIDSIRARAPALGRWCEEQSRKASSGQPYAKTPLGRVRLVDQNYRPYQERWESNRSQMLNQPIQGGCADGYKIAAAMLWERREEFSGNPLLVNMIHDEFVLEVDDEAAESDAELLEEIMKEGMRETFGNDIPVSVDVSVSERWEKGGD
jgi:DNA polymerase I